MNILLVNTYHYPGGGDSTYTFNLAEMLRGRGHQVAFFAMQDIHNHPDPNSDLFVSHINFRKLNRNKNLISGLRVLGRAIYSLEARRKFSRLLSRVNPDIVHLQNIHAHITPSVIIEAKKQNLPVVWTLHDYKLICPNSHLFIDETGQLCEACARGTYYQAFLKRCKKGSRMASGMAAVEAYMHRVFQIWKKVDSYLAPSQFLRRKFIDRGFPPDRVQYMPVFLPKVMFQNAEADDGYFLFFGKIERIKGIRPLIEAVRQLPKVRLVLAGRIDQEFETEFLQSLPTNCVYVGMKQGNDLWKLVKRARAVVVPSLWYENQPSCILEAFAFGKPVIASDLGGMTELVKDQQRGLLVPAGDVGMLSNAIRWIDDHPQCATKMGNAAYEYALVEHNADYHYQKLFNIYDCVVGNRCNP